LSEGSEKRPSKDEYYLGIAKAVAKRSTCLRRKFGAIITKDDVIVSTGYNGSTRGVINCSEIGCLKDEVNAPEYSDYEFCIAVHAEENAVINAARNGSSTLSGTMYIYGEYTKDGSLTESIPCERCRRVIINAGIRTVITKKSDDSIKRIDVSDWIKEDTQRYIEKLEEAKKKRQPPGREG
jgi:dCMP deaminase